MRMIRWFKAFFRRLFRRRRIDIRVLDALGYDAPSSVPPKLLLRMMDEGEAWAAVMACPCGCGAVIELLLSPNARPRWTLTERGDLPTLHPSVWRSTGCRSHFWVRDGQIHWVP